MKVARRVLVAAGTIMIGYAAVGAITDVDVNLVGMLLFLGAVLALHDAVLLPITIGVGALVGRLLPRPLWTPVRVALLISVAVGIVALPLVLGYGRTADNPSALPLSYGLGLLLLLAVVWTSATIATVARIRRRARPRSGLSEGTTQATARGPG